MNKKHPYTTKDVSPMHCIICDKDIKHLPMSDKDAPEHSMWDDAIVSDISAGYGSTLDGDVYLIAICDDCLKKKRYEGRVVYLYDYMFNNSSSMMRYKYNANLHRKMKLKRILSKS